MPKQTYQPHTSSAQSAGEKGLSGGPNKPAQQTSLPQASSNAPNALILGENIKKAAAAICLK